MGAAAEGPIALLLRLLMRDPSWKAGQRLMSWIGYHIDDWRCVPSVRRCDVSAGSRTAAEVARRTANGKGSAMQMNVGTTGAS